MSIEAIIYIISVSVKVLLTWRYYTSLSDLLALRFSTSSWILKVALSSGQVLLLTKASVVLIKKMLSLSIWAKLKSHF